MKHINTRFYLIYLFIFGICTINIYSYDYVKSVNNDNEIDVFNQIMHEQLIESINDEYRVRQVIEDSITTSDSEAKDSMITEDSHTTVSENLVNSTDTSILTITKETTEENLILTTALSESSILLHTSTVALEQSTYLTTKPTETIDAITDDATEQPLETTNDITSLFEYDSTAVLISRTTSSNFTVPTSLLADAETTTPPPATEINIDSITTASPTTLLIPSTTTFIASMDTTEIKFTDFVNTIETPVTDSTKTTTTTTIGPVDTAEPPFTDSTKTTTITTSIGPVDTAEPSFTDSTKTTTTTTIGPVDTAEPPFTDSTKTTTATTTASASGTFTIYTTSMSTTPITYTAAASNTMATFTSPTSTVTTTTIAPVNTTTIFTGTTFIGTTMTTTSSATPNLTTISLITTGSSMINLTTTTTTTTTTFIYTTTQYNPDTCKMTTEVQLPNGTCVSKDNGQIMAVNILNSSANSTEKAEALILYFSATANLNTSLNTTNVLTLDKIDTYVSSLSNVSLTITSKSSFIMVQKLIPEKGVTILGASFVRNIGGEVVDTNNFHIAMNTNLSAAAIINSISMADISSLNMLIIDDPSVYRNIDNSNNKTLLSSVIVASISTYNAAIPAIDISLYFQNLLEPVLDVNGTYVCSFYDTITSKWNESGCTKPLFNNVFNRFECSCNHLSSFALIWLPQSLSITTTVDVTTMTTTRTTTTTFITTTTTQYNPDTCNMTTQVQLPNGTCVSKDNGQITAVNTLNSSANSTEKAEALILYFSATANLNTSLNTTNFLTLDKVDTYLSNLSNVSLTITSKSSFIMVQQPNQDKNVTVLGASFVHNIGGEVVDTNNVDNATNSNLSAAAIIRNISMVDVTSFNMLIIDNPVAYTDIDNSSDKTLASSIIVAKVQSHSSISIPMNISLYFQVLNQYRPNITARYLCSFYDTINSRWNESGCTEPQYNSQFDRYECSCNHLTSFALIWLPQSLSTNGTRSLDAQDIASLVFQSISIVCFLAIIIHAIVIRLIDPSMGLRAYDLLPLLSGASTTILFIFYIALGMTVYTRTPDQGQTNCFLSSSVLMFFVYFFLIFMFCAKTSVGYFNYLRFVHLFPQPSHRKLLIMLLISFFISITWVAFAAGFNSNPSYKITQLYSFKLCWFTHDVIYYFVTISVCLFILLNIITFILVAKNIISHVQDATSSPQLYERMKRCVLVLLSSSVTQGIGWLFGPFISLVNPTAGNVLGWFFIIFNGLEGFWSILLYIIIRCKHMDEQKYVIAKRDLITLNSSIADKYKKSSIRNARQESDGVTADKVQYRDTRNGASQLFDDVRDVDAISGSIEDDIENRYF